MLVNDLITKLESMDRALFVRILSHRYFEEIERVATYTINDIKSVALVVKSYGVQRLEKLLHEDV